MKFFSHRKMKASKDWFAANAKTDDNDRLVPIVDIFVNTKELGGLKIFQLLATLMNVDIPIVITTRTSDKIEITFILYGK